jgi:hypothetical protein
MTATTQKSIEHIKHLIDVDDLETLKKDFMDAMVINEENEMVFDPNKEGCFLGYAIEQGKDQVVNLILDIEKEHGTNVRYMDENTLSNMKGEACGIRQNAIRFLTDTTVIKRVLRRFDAPWYTDTDFDESEMPFDETSWCFVTDDEASNLDRKQMMKEVFINGPHLFVAAAALKLPVFRMLIRHREPNLNATYAGVSLIAFITDYLWKPRCLKHRLKPHQSIHTLSERMHQMSVLQTMVDIISNKTGSSYELDNPYVDFSMDQLEETKEKDKMSESFKRAKRSLDYVFIDDEKPSIDDFPEIKALMDKVDQIFDCKRQRND